MTKTTDERDMIEAAFNRCKTIEAKQSLADAISRAFVPAGPQGEKKKTLADFKKIADEARAAAPAPSDGDKAYDQRSKQMKDAWRTKDSE